MTSLNPPTTVPTASDETWCAECRECGTTLRCADREAARLAALEHMTETGHVGEVCLSARFAVWRCDSEDREAFRAHHMTISIGLRAEGADSAGCAG
jgi:hypothetical protein